MKRESSPDVRFEIFERLNSGSVALNPEELRNCMYRGPYNEFLKTLAKKPAFLQCIGSDKPLKRMADVELVLRFMAFYSQTYLAYKSPMKAFLNKEMMLRRHITDKQSLDKMRADFKQALDLARTVFGDHAFRRFNPGDGRTPGRWERAFNKALFDPIAWVFTRYTKHEIVPKKDCIREALIHLLSNDTRFVDSIVASTGDNAKVQYRFECWYEVVKSILGQSTSEPRLFSLDLKKDLWERNSTCQICSQRIEVLDDAEIDHIQEYWKGGKTIPQNVRLAHRFCNRSRRAVS